MTLILRRASASRPFGEWQYDDFDVYDDARCVGRIYRNAATDQWFWGVSFMLTGRKGYDAAGSLEAAKAAFKAEYEKWKASQ